VRIKLGHRGATSAHACARAACVVSWPEAQDRRRGDQGEYRPVVYMRVRAACDAAPREEQRVVRLSGSFGSNAMIEEHKAKCSRISRSARSCRRCDESMMLFPTFSSCDDP
jgi:hypothetical protein